MLRRKRIGELLVDENIITKKQLDLVFDQKEDGEKIGEALVRLRLVTEDRLTAALADQYDLDVIDIDKVQINPDILNFISEDFARENMVFPIQLEDDKLVIAIADPFDYQSYQNIRMMTGLDVVLKLATGSNILRNIVRYYSKREELETLIPELLKERDLQLIKDEDLDDSPIIKLIDKILEIAVILEASDVHFDPQENEVKVRYRIDGALTTHSVFPKRLQNLIESRIKIMANLDITEKRLPQDGRIKIEAANQRVDIRVSTLPTYYGEKIVLRILETGDLIESIENLGFGKRNSKLYRKLISNSYGIVLVTGPTGSGKTTTLYSGLSELNNDDVNIITVEDPVEIELKGINQVQVNDKVGLTFGNGLRSILRQDPDIVMVGEIRDLETADIAIKASLTGHLVFSTLHTNDALSTIYRLYDMSVKPYLISASIKGIMAQRLVRTLCPHCGYDDDLTELEQEVFSRYKIPKTKVRRAKGCSKCNNGYLGRTVIVEILEIDEHLQNLIVNQVSITELKRYAYSHGFVSMFRDGLGKVLAGRTTLKELLKVVNYE